MEQYLHVQTDVRCPACRAVFGNTLGEVRVQVGLPSVYVRLGERIPFPSDSRPFLGRGWLDTVALIFDSDDNYSYWSCQSCGRRYDAPALRVELGCASAIELKTVSEWEGYLGQTRGDRDAFFLLEGVWRPVEL